MAETGVRDSGRFRNDLAKLWNDMYYGNGKPGVVTRIQSLEDVVVTVNDRIKESNERHDKRDKRDERLLWLLISSIILAVLNLVLKH